MTEHHDPTGAPVDDSDGGTGVADRRALFAKGGVAAAAAAAAVAGLGAAGRARAADGDELIIGENNSGTTTTGLQGSTIFVQGGSAAAAIIGNEQADDGVRGSSMIANGVLGSSGTGTGVRGTASESGGIGVYGGHTSDTQSGTGIVGESELGTAIIARGAEHDLAADGSGRVALLTPGQSGSPSDDGATGTIARDASGNLWYCYASDSWQIIAGPDAPEPEAPETPEVTGTFVPIDPVRVFDSRQDAFPASGLLAPNEERTLSVADGRDLTGVVTAPDAIPDGATAIAFNVTVTGTTGPNFVSVVPGDAPGYTTSSINWSGPDQSVANGSIVRIDGSRQVKVFGGDQTGSTHVILDVTGYFT